MKTSKTFTLLFLLFILVPASALASVLYNNVSDYATEATIPGVYQRPTQWVVEGDNPSNGIIIRAVTLWNKLSSSFFSVNGSATINLNGSTFSHTVKSSDLNVAQPITFTGSMTTDTSNFYIDTYEAGGRGFNNNPSRVYGSSADTWNGTTSYALSSNGIYSVGVSDLWFQVCDTTYCGYSIVSSDITANTTWLRNQVYKVSGNVHINSGVTLTVEPGVIVKFDTATTSGMTVDGTLVASATSTDDAIYFTSWKDDRIPFYGDTNGDGTSTSPAAGDWDMIKVNSGGSATLDYVYMRYGGSSLSKMLYNNGGTIDMSDGEISYSNTGVYSVPGSVTTLASTTIAYNVYGFYHDGGTTTLSDLGNIIVNNSSYGLYNGTNATITATMIYWPSTTTAATSTGPYHPIYNSSGNGDTISSFITWSPAKNIGHFISGSSAVSSTTDEVRWQWAASSTQTYAAELSSAIGVWNTLNPIKIVAAATSVTLEIDEVDSNLYDWSGDTFSLGGGKMFTSINKAKLFDNTSAEIQNAWTHELGHDLGLDHSYVGNVLYYKNSPQTSLGTQDILDYNHCWVTYQGNCPRI